MSEKPVKIQTALEIIYYLMAVDGEMSEPEVALFNDIGVQLDKTFARRKAILMSRWSESTDATPEELISRAETAVEGSNASIGHYESNPQWMPGRVLIWNMVSIAQCDGKYDSIERDMVKRVAALLEVEMASVLEMEVAARALYDIENALECLSGRHNSNEEMSKQLKKRKLVIKTSVKQLLQIEED